MGTNSNDAPIITNAHAADEGRQETFQFTINGFELFDKQFRRDAELLEREQSHVATRLQYNQQLVLPNNHTVVWVTMKSKWSKRAMRAHLADVCLLHLRRVSPTIAQFLDADMEQE